VSGNAERSSDVLVAEAKRPGPRSLMSTIEQEMRSRAERGELKDGVTDECRALEKWARINFPEHSRPPKAKSIMNTLGKLYYELKQPSDARI
jgi:hypothetical protein